MKNLWPFFQNSRNLWFFIHAVVPTIETHTFAIKHQHNFIYEYNIYGIQFNRYLLRVERDSNIKSPPPLRYSTTRLSTAQVLIEKGELILLFMFSQLRVQSLDTKIVLLRLYVLSHFVVHRVEAMQSCTTVQPKKSSIPTDNDYLHSFLATVILKNY